MPDLSPDTQAALAVVEACLTSLKIGGDQGRAQFVSTMHPQGRMSHARYYQGKPVFFHDLPHELADYVGPAWEGGVVFEECIDGEPVVMVDHDLAMIWTPFWVRVDGVLASVGTNCFSLLKITSGDGTEPPKGEWGSPECNWVWKITVLNDTGRSPTSAEVSIHDLQKTFTYVEKKERLDKEYENSQS